MVQERDIDHKPGLWVLSPSLFTPWELPSSVPVMKLPQYYEAGGHTLPEETKMEPW